MISPLFHDIHQEPVKAFRVCWFPVPTDEYEEALAAEAAGAPPRYFADRDGIPVRYAIQPLTIDERESVGSIAEAEDRVMALVEPSAVWSPPRQSENPPTFVGDMCAALPIMINRHCNLIAARTRRAAGNIVLCHSDVTALIADGKFGHLVNGEPQKIGRWKHAGAINGCILLYECDDLPRDRLWVAYVGSKNDAPAHLIETDDGLMLGWTGLTGDQIISRDYISCIGICGND